MKIAFIAFDGITWLDMIGIYDPISRLKSMKYMPNLTWDFCSFTKRVSICSWWFIGIFGLKYNIIVIIEISIQIEVYSELDLLRLLLAILLNLPLAVNEPLLFNLPPLPLILLSSRYYLLCVIYIVSNAYAISAKQFIVISLLICFSSFSGNRDTYPYILSLMNRPSFMVS